MREQYNIISHINFHFHLVRVFRVTFYNDSPRCACFYPGSFTFGKMKALRPHAIVNHSIVKLTWDCGLCFQVLLLCYAFFCEPLINVEKKVQLSSLTANCIQFQILKCSVMKF